MDFKILTTKPEKDYELLDSGENRKLERFGSVIVDRPDPQALWKKNLGKAEWEKAQAVFSHEKDAEKAEWKISKKIPEDWNINLADLKFKIKLSSFKHVGVFPEQAENWKWIHEVIEKEKKAGKENVQVLNLFGYTGGATLAAAKAGAEVVHLDGSRAAITQAKENAELSGLGSKKIRWMLDDALVFLKREIKRGSKYDGIILDPPAFGRGPKGEVWKIEENFLDLLALCKGVLSDAPVFFLINGYASGYSSLAYKNALKGIFENKTGTLESGELTIQESGGERLLPAGIFARWQK